MNRKILNLENIISGGRKKILIDETLKLNLEKLNRELNLNLKEENSEIYIREIIKNNNKIILFCNDIENKLHYLILNEKKNKLLRYIFTNYKFDGRIKILNINRNKIKFAIYYHKSSFKLKHEFIKNRIEEIEMVNKDLFEQYISGIS